MFGIRILTVLLLCFLFFGCKKENGKRNYEMVLTFDSGDVFKDHGVIHEKKLKRRNGQELHVDVFDRFTLLKIKDEKLVCSYRLTLESMKPVAFASGMSGTFKGDVYFEGEYTQKGRTYEVENGYFEFIWRNQSTGQPMNSEIQKGKWTLKRM